MREVHRMVTMLVLITLGVASFAAPALAQQTYTVTVKTSSPSYTGVQPIAITGNVSPVPPANSGVVITIKNSNGSVADINEVMPSTTTGNFNWTSIPGGNTFWETGTFVVNATWGAGNSTATAATTFTYSPAQTSTSTSSSTTSISSTSTTSITATSTSSVTSTSSSTSTSTTSSTTTTTTSSTSTTTSTSSSSTTSSTTTSTTPPPVTVTVTAPPSTSSSTSTSSTKSSGINLGSLVLPIVVVVVVVVAALGFVMWRRKVASDYEKSVAARKP